jgi:WD40 repeat protein
VSSLPRSRRCPDCGTEIAAEPGLPELCPKCLLSLALRESDPISEDESEALTLDRPSAGHILGERYQIREVLGRGGMGEVFRAFDLKLRVDVALKALRADRVGSERGREMLRSEVRTARQVISPNVCRIFDLVEEDGHELVSMEYIDGVTLGETLWKRGPLELVEAGEIASQFLSGLEAIHQAGLVHRDFKPENVMLTRAGRVVVMDFGLAKAGSEGATGTIAGTLGYMAPEQARGDAIDARADVFAAAVVLAEMLSVGGLGSAEARQALWRAIRKTPPQVPEGPWAAVLRAALAERPQERPVSARALARALEEATERLPGFEAKRPYPGLSSFTEEDAEYFFGREVEVEAVWKKLKRPRLLALIGPSGVGKTSFLRAGLLPTLPRGWAAVVVTPGNHPFRALAQALAPAFAGDAQAFQALLQFEEADNAVSLFQRFRRRHEHALVVVDQFEELFTLNPPDVQRAVATLLGRLVLDADSHVILSLRDDFLFRCHALEALAPATSDLTILGTLSESALRRALVQPALAGGYRFADEALVDEMLAEVANERGALPLLAFAASRLWEKRDRERGLLTREAYREIGGVAGALAQHAEATLDRIGSARTPLVRELFRNLVTSEGTRAVRDRGELLSVFDKPGAPTARAEAEEVLNALVDARLLTAYERTAEDGKSQQQVEVVHESLLSAWPRLVRWQTQDADGAQLRDQLRLAAQLWQDRGQADDLLWSGQAYLDYSLWRERYAAPLSATENAFARAMEANATRRRRRRRAAVTALVGVVSTVAIVTSLLWQRAATEVRQREAAELLALGRLQLAGHPTAALAYAIASLERSDNAPARRFAVEALWKGPTAFFFADPISPVLAQWSPDGRWLAGSSTQGVVVLDLARGTRQRLTSAPEAAVGFSKDGTRLVTKEWKNLTGVLRLWTLPEGQLLQTWTLPEPADAVLRDRRLLTFAPDPNAPSSVRSRLVRERSIDGGPERTLGSWQPRELSDWDVDSAGAWLISVEGGQLLRRRLDALGARPRSPGRHDGALSVWGSSGRVVTGDALGEVRLWDLGRGQVERTLRSPEAARMTALDRPGRYLATAPGLLPSGAFSLFDLQAPRGADPQRLLDSDLAYSTSLDFHPSGDWLASGHGGVVLLWGLTGKRTIVLRGQEPVGMGLAYTPDGRLVSTSAGGVVRLWPLFADRHAEVRELWSQRAEPSPSLQEGIDVDRAGQRAVVLQRFGAAKVIVLPLDGSPARVHALKPGRGPLRLIAPGFDPTGRYVAYSYGELGRPEAASIRVLDLVSGSERELRSKPDGGECKGEWSTLQGEGGSPLWLADGRLVSDGPTGLRLWDLKTGSSRRLRPCREELADYGIYRATPDARVVLGLLRGDSSVGETSTLWAFDLTAGTERDITSHGSRVQSLALDPTGSTLVTGDADGVVRVGPLLGDGEPHLLYGHSRAVTTVAVSPDRRWIASGSDDGTIRLWPMPDGPPLHTLPHQELLEKLRSLTNLRVVADPAAATGYRLEPGPLPSLAKPPEW